MKATMLFLMLVCGGTRLQPADPWTAAQLLEPAELFAIIQHPPANPPLVLCVGPSALIKGSVDAGPAHEAKSLDRLKAILEPVNRQRAVVIYCGCCPFVHCPNVRPAFALLKEMHFVNARLLDLPHNIRVDWIEKGYGVK